MEPQHLKELLQKYNAGQASAEEKALVEQWYDQVAGPEPVFSSEAAREDLRRKLHASLQSLTETPGESPAPALHLPASRPSYAWLKWAAAVLLALGTTLIFYLNQPRQQTAAREAGWDKGLDIAPGGPKATLTLADGSRIVLNEAQNGTLAHQNQLAIQKTRDGQLVYNFSGMPQGASGAGLNRLSTPRGGQYQVILADGTKVWLNAASTLSFPAVFPGSSREVELEGEAYFEVAKNKNRPFRVKTAQSRVEVLGTQFNLMAYANEPNQETTLLEGAVKVSRVQAGQAPGKETSLVLVPGQQARLPKQGPGIALVSGIDTDYVTAWKEGVFLFDNTGLEVVMHQVERWYDVEVVYEGSKPEVNFTGVVPRSNQVSRLLEVLELAGGVEFRIEEKKIIVTKNL